MENIKVSVIVPVYNCEPFLHKCLDSLQNQTLKELEIICINDGSSDNSLTILEDYAKKDDRFIIINQENHGQGHARNQGINIAKGEYLGFVDSDDWIDLNFYEKLYATAKKYDADIATTSMIRQRKYHKKYRVNYKEEKIYTNIYDKINITKYPKQCYMPNKIVKRQKLNEFNIRYVENKVYEDIEFVLKVLFYLEKMVSVPEIYYYYRVNPQSTVKKKQTLKMNQDKIDALTAFVNFAEEKNLKLPEKSLILYKKKIRFFGIPILTTIYWKNYSKKYLFDLIYLGKKNEN